MADGSVASQMIRALIARQQAQSDATNELARPIPQARGPSQAEMAANPNGPPVAITRAPDPSDLLARAQQLLKSGAISQDQYQDYAQKVQPFPSATPYGSLAPQ